MTRLTKTNLKDFVMKLPFKVASSLNIAEEGLAGIHLGEGSITNTVYKTCKDGRISFKQGWKDFLMGKHLWVGTAVMITFRHNIHAELQMVMIINMI